MQKISTSLGYFLSATFILLSTRTSNISRSLEVLFVFTLIFLIVFFRKGFRFDKFAGKLLLFLSLLIVAYSMYFSSFNPLFSINLILICLLSYMVLKMLKKRFFHFFVQIVYVLSLISLPLFFFQQVSFETIHRINSFPEKQFSTFSFGDEFDSNSLIYTVKDNARHRNSGFMWEPGAFAAILALSIMLNIIRKRATLDRKTIVMTVALITTFSTMGYIALLFLISFYISERQKYKAVFYSPFIAVLFILIFRLDFIGGKIIEEYDSIENTTDVVLSSKSAHNERASLGRMASLKFDYNDFKRYPIIGVGGQFEARTKTIYTKLNRTNGWGNYIITYGSVGILLFIINMTFSFRLLFRQYDLKGYWAGVVLILIISFSNNILSQPLFIGLQLYHFIGNDKQ